MKKMYHWLCILLISNTSLFAQNLITNPGFEDTTIVPSNYKGLGWICVTGSPDLFHPQNSHPDLQVPNNIAGYQLAYDGINYAGLFIFVGSSPNSREHLQNELVDPLQPGTKYYFSMYISRADSLEALGNGPGANKLGLKFSVDPYERDVNEPPMDNFAHIYSDNIYLDQHNWSLFSGS